MFKIENVFCDDKKLADVLRALAGLTLGHPQPVPVVNAEKTKKGAIKQVSNGKLTDQFGVWLQDKNADEIVTSKDVITFLKNAGLSPNSVSYVLREAVKAQLLKRGKSKGRNSSYHVVKRV